MDFQTIDNKIQEIAQDHDIDLRTIKNNIPQFYFLLSQVGDHFKSNNEFIYMNGKKRSYSIYLVGYFVDIFNSICFKYGIMGSLLMYSFFVGVPINTIRAWIKKYSDIVVSEDMPIIYNDYFNNTYLHNKQYYNNLLCSSECDKEVEKLNAVSVMRIKSIQDIAETSTDDKLRNSSQIVGQITLHNDKLITRISDNRTAMLIDNLPVLALEKSHNDMVKDKAKDQKPTETA